MVRVVGGIILIRIGFELFSDSSSSGSLIPSSKAAQKGDIAFAPLAMPLMVGPGAIATTLGMTSLVKHSEFELISFFAIACAILMTMVVTYLCLAYAKNLFGRIGPVGIDAVTRIVGFLSPLWVSGLFSMASSKASRTPAWCKFAERGFH